MFEEAFTKTIKANRDEFGDQSMKTSMEASSRSSSSDCGPETQGYTCLPTQSFTYTFTNPTSDCDLTMTLLVTPCYDANGNVIFNFETPGTNFWNFTGPYSSSCVAWINNLLNAPNTNEIIDQFILENRQIFIEQFLTDWLNNQSGVNLSNFACAGGPILTLGARYYDGNCSARCLVYDINEDPPLYLEDVPCAEGGCCVEETFFCLDSNNEAVIEFGPIRSPVSDCTNFISVDCSQEMNGGILWEPCNQTIDCLE